ncbi:MAG: hypothetical protein HY000_01285 [Planctomycetes bacterium]|nr:hypothetical protein [Planctomycetota bacterium]
MKAMQFSWLWRSFQFKAVLTATLSLALIIAILFAFCRAWLNQQQLEGQQRRSEDLLRHLTARLQLGVMVNSADLIKPIVRDAFLSREVLEISVFDADGVLLLHLPEERHESSLVRSQQGTGLGLSLVRKIATLHGGRVWVESDEGKGSQFYVELPRRLEQLPEGQALQPADA